MVKAFRNDQKVLDDPINYLVWVIDKNKNQKCK